MNDPETPKSEKYREALLALESKMTETRRKLLSVHYHFPDRSATMPQISDAMGWANYSSANIHYGSLAKLIGDQLGFHLGTVHLNSVCKFTRAKDHWILTLREELAEALESLSWT